MRSNYTEKAQKALKLAEKTAARIHSGYVGTEHILAGILKEGTGVAARVLTENGVEEEQLLTMIKELISRTPYPAPTVKLNPEIKNFYDFTTDDLIVENYQTWPQIKNIPIAV